MYGDVVRTCITVSPVEMAGTFVLVCFGVLIMAFAVALVKATS